MNYSLLIMAGGMGSRYGGLKQVDSFGPSNESILDYSIYDAINAGFNNIIILSSPKLKRYFEEKYIKLFDNINNATVKIVVQDPNYGLENFKYPKSREKPWGTGHAVLCCENYINNTFAIINADDFYGRKAFKKIIQALMYIEENNIKATMISYDIENTLSDFGGVSRGVCNIDRNKLISIKETHEIVKDGNLLKGVQDNNIIEMSVGTQVAMNLIGFQNSIFSKIRSDFINFLKKNINNKKSEFLIPDILDDISRDYVHVESTDENWFGVTYPADSPFVKKNIKKLVENKTYPSPLW